MTNDNWLFYMLRCGDGSLYSGITNNLDERIKKHACGKGAKYTASHLPVALAYSETLKSQTEAMARETEVKRWTKAKKELLASSNKPQRANKTSKVTFPLTSLRDARIAELVKTTPHKTLALWAIDCAERVVPYFEKNYPQDKRPRIAIATLKKWIKTGVFSMAVIRKASLDAHAAARDVGEDSPARSAAHATGQAVATAHVRTHSMGPAIYALQAISRAVKPEDAEAAIAKEREWQYKHLLSLIKLEAGSTNKSRSKEEGSKQRPFTRERHPMPDYFLKALKKNKLLAAYEARPPYQRNDYIGWVTRAKLEATRTKRLNQMLAELKQGHQYMGMDYNPSK